MTMRIDVFLVIDLPAGPLSSQPYLPTDFGRAALRELAGELLCELDRVPVGAGDPSYQ